MPTPQNYYMRTYSPRNRFEETECPECSTVLLEGDPGMAIFDEDYDDEGDAPLVICCCYNCAADYLERLQ